MDNREATRLLFISSVYYRRRQWREAWRAIAVWLKILEEIKSPYSFSQWISSYVHEKDWPSGKGWVQELYDSLVPEFVKRRSFQGGVDYSANKKGMDFLRSKRKELSQFLGISLDSLREIDNQVEVGIIAVKANEPSS